MRRSTLTYLGIAACIAVAMVAFVAQLSARRHHLAIARAGVPAVPDLSRWPKDFANSVRGESDTAAQDSNPDAHLQRIAELYCANGFVPQGIQALSSLRLLQPEQARWPYLLADLKIRSGDWSAAIEPLDDALKHKPDYVPALIKRASVLEHLGRIDPAVADLKEALGRDPSDSAAEFQLALLEANSGRREEAQHRLESLCQAHPEIRPFHEALADTLSGTDPAASARERAVAATCEVYPSTVDPWLDSLDSLCFDSNRMIIRSIEFRREGRFAEFEALMGRVIDLSAAEPANPIAWDLISNFYLKTGKPERATEVLERGVREFPDDAQIRILLVKLLDEEQKVDEACAKGQDAVRHWPDRADVHAALGAALRDAGAFEKAEGQFRECLRLDPTLTEAEYNLGVCLLEGGNRSEAAAAFDRALAMRPDYPEALYAAAKLRLESGDEAGAAPEIERLLQLRPGEAAVRQLAAARSLLRGSDILQSGNLAAAEHEFASGLQLDPDFSALLKALGDVESKQGNYGAAIETLRRYVKAEPGDAEGYAALARALRSAGKAEEARAAIESGLRAVDGDSAAKAELSRLLEGP